MAQQWFEDPVRTVGREKERVARQEAARAADRAAAAEQLKKRRSI